MQTSKSMFKVKVLTTFGKLNEQEIDECDASPDRLAALLVDRYGLSPTDAQSRVDEFCGNSKTSCVSAGKRQ